MIVRPPEAFEPLYFPAPFKGFFGGRGSAKSHSFAEALVICSGPHAAKIPASSRAIRGAPELIGCFREVQNSIRDSVKKLLDNKIDKLGYRSYFTSTDNEIRGARGELFIFRGLRDSAEGARSIEGMTKVWLEEAHQASQPSLDTLLPTLRADGAEFWASWNPDKQDDPIDIMLRGPVPPPDAIVCEVNFDRNPYFPEFLRKQMEWDLRRDVDRYNHIWRGQYRARSEARVFRNWCVKEFASPDVADFMFGADWGFSTDPSVLVRCFLTGHTLYVDYEAYAVGCEIHHTPALFGGKESATKEHLQSWGPKEEEKFKGVPGARRYKIVADSARPETISYMRGHGFPLMEAANKGKGSVEDGIEFLKQYDIVVHPRCKHTIDELSFYSWKTDKQTAKILPVLEDKKNHVIDALRYAVERIRRSGAAQWAALGAMQQRRD